MVSVFVFNQNKKICIIKELKYMPNYITTNNPFHDIFMEKFQDQEFPLCCSFTPVKSPESNAKTDNSGVCCLSTDVTNPNSKPEQINGCKTACPPKPSNLGATDNDSCSTDGGARLAAACGQNITDLQRSNATMQGKMTASEADQLWKQMKAMGADVSKCTEDNFDAYAQAQVLGGLASAKAEASNSFSTGCEQLAMTHSNMMSCINAVACQINSICHITRNTVNNKVLSKMSVTIDSITNSTVTIENTATISGSVNIDNVSINQISQSIQQSLTSVMSNMQSQTNKDSSKGVVPPTGQTSSSDSNQSQTINGMSNQVNLSMNQVTNIINNYINVSLSVNIGSIKNSTVDIKQAAQIMVSASISNMLMDAYSQVDSQTMSAILKNAQSQSNDQDKVGADTGPTSMGGIITMVVGAVVGIGLIGMIAKISGNKNKNQRLSQLPSSLPIKY